jgi:hypothetical protein
MPIFPDRDHHSHLYGRPGVCARGREAYLGPPCTSWRRSLAIGVQFAEDIWREPSAEGLAD